MDSYQCNAAGEHTQYATKTECGSVGCAVGHGPNAGIPAFYGEQWDNYCNRVFMWSRGPVSPEWRWCFGAGWAERDNTPRGAAKRILYFLRKGVPSDAGDQAFADAPLCYLNEPLDLPDLTPAATQRLGFVAAAMTEATAK